MAEAFELLYRELHRLAHRHRLRWDGNATMGTTALVHEAYVKLVDGEHLAFDDRRHFFAVASRAMRHLLCDYARDRGRLKRGGGMRRATDDPDAVAAPVSDADLDMLVALDVALTELEEEDERLARVVECRFFAGLSIPETAEALGISPATVKRDWALARAWLYRRLDGTR
jgi:RNA polymerase sigma factor (TIGR02999 family)